MTAIAILGLHNIMILLVALAITVFALLFLTKRKYGIVEEDYISIPSFVSPAFKIVRLMFIKTVLSLEVLLLILSIIITSFTAGYVTSYTYSRTQIAATDLPIVYSAMAISDGHVSETIIDKIFQNYSYIRIVQVYNEVLIGNKTSLSYIFPLIIDCTKATSSILKFNVSIQSQIIELCTALNSQNNTIILDINSGVNVSVIRIGEEVFHVMKTNISRYVNIPLLPGIPLGHSIGSIGGSVITISPSIVGILPFKAELLNTICKEECDVKTIVLILDRCDKCDDIARNVLRYFNIFAIRTNDKILIFSSSFVPTPQTILGILTLVALTLVISASISGGVAEKIADVVYKLVLLGITRDLIMSSTYIALLSLLLIFLAPLIVLTIMGFISATTLITYIISSFASAFLVVLRALSIMRSAKAVKPVSKPFVVFTSSTRVDIHEFKEMLQKMFLKDDVFAISELEVLPSLEGFYEMRIELVYRKRLATLITIEMSERKEDGVWRYDLYADVWSIEELNRSELNRLAIFALSKIQGVLINCASRYGAR
jgi:hypothetical protein